MADGGFEGSLSSQYKNIGPETMGTIPEMFQNISDLERIMYYVVMDRDFYYPESGEKV